MALWALYSIRQFWQTDTLRLSAATSMAELFTYSVALIMLARSLPIGAYNDNILACSKWD
ncbi:hypothetical protein JCM19237_364 [Photobacterium aphoticum]|uniref:Uncharacterized protein n=1 Tax=Photobacterium aphoticum TaxID=754436 RepID=A0A090R0S4_9GAMM|nr:hypothetical protein JCM19237_364 [Photobacterium aphoticum]